MTTSPDTEEEHFYSLLKKTHICVDINYPKDASSPDFDENCNLDCHPTIIFNARELNSAKPTLDREGFCLLPSDVQFHDVYNKKEVAHNLILLKKNLTSYLGAKHLFPLGHIVRKENSKNNAPFVNRPPADFVHCDWSPSRINTLPLEPDPHIITNHAVTPDQIKRWINASKSWAIFNAWIPLRTVINRPLALCSINSVQWDNINPNVFFKETRQKNSAIMSLNYHPSHQWFYYPLMQSNELLFFKQFDSMDGANNFIPVFHTAFKLINKKSIATNPRKSIEFRFLATFS